MAGGRVSLEAEDPQALALHLTERATQYLELDRSDTGIPLI
jgi:hypothetical protein